MFQEFDSDMLKKWHSLTYAERKKAIEDKEVSIAVDINIKVKQNKEIIEEHNYYKVSTFGNCKLIDNINVCKIIDTEVKFSVSLNNDSNIITVKLNEEKSIEFRTSPYIVTYIIKVSNAKYGQVYEL